MVIFLLSASTKICVSKGILISLVYHSGDVLIDSRCKKEGGYAFMLLKYFKKLIATNAVVCLSEQGLTQSWAIMMPMNYLVTHWLTSSTQGKADS